MFNAVPYRTRNLSADTSTGTQYDTAKQETLAVVQVWLDRLQAMTLITTFFVSIDSMLYGYATATLLPNSRNWSNVDLVKVATLGGAIILHACASILAYLTSFVLIRYRLDDAEEKVQDSRDASLRQSHVTKSRSLSFDVDPQSIASTSACAAPHLSQDLRSLVSVYQIRPFECAHRSRNRAVKPPSTPEAPDTGDAAALRTLQRMVHTLSRCHTVVAVMSNIGFVLALLGTIVYFWTALPVALGSFASVCLGGSLVAGVFAIM
ncbi:hypothetical protein BC628DRAFT_1418062 [Trametes gibbosa]|nr:hypothetical protein BC628DRAFT_1418062 [Trametes gibbosa]